MAKGTARLPQTACWPVERRIRLSVGQHEQTCRRSDHVLDAVIAALNARAAARALTTTPNADPAEAVQ